MGLIQRREFLLGGAVAIPQRNMDALRVEVMEVFSPPGGPAALLVHHADEAERESFGSWLRAHSGNSVVCTLMNGTRINGRIFRISLCFGRGLILFRDSVSIRVKDILSLASEKV